jgi:uncharacterized membrane protein
MSTDTPRNEPDAPRRPLAAALTILAGALGVLIRLIPHPANFVPVGAMGIFGGAKLRGWKAYLLPIGVMVVSDLGLWAIARFDPKYGPFHSSRLYVYGSFLIYVAIGRLLRGRQSPLRLCGASLLGSLQFFVITNLCTWLFQPLESMEGVPAAYIYSRDLSGLLTCFAAALPFYAAESPLSLHALFVGDPRYNIFGLVVGDLFFTFGLFVLYGALAPKAVPASRGAVQQEGAAP